VLGHGITAYPKFVQEVWIIEFDYFNYSADLAAMNFIYSERDAAINSTACF